MIAYFQEYHLEASSANQIEYTNYIKLIRERLWLLKCCKNENFCYIFHIYVVCFITYLSIH